MTLQAPESKVSRVVPLPPSRRGVIQVGNLILNRDTYQVWIGRQPIGTGAQEFDLLEAMALQPDMIIPTADLSMLLWQESGVLCRRRLAVMVYRLRTKLEGLHPYELMSSRGHGYGLVRGEPASDAP